MMKTKPFFLILLPMVAMLPLRIQAQKSRPKLGNVRAAGVSVHGQTPEQARKTLLTRLKGKLNTSVSLSDGVKTVQRRRRELGVGLDIDAMIARAKEGKSAPLLLTLNQEAFKSALTRLAPRFRTAARNAAIVERKGRVTIRRPVNGRDVNVPATTTRFSTLLKENAGAHVLRVVLSKKPPKVTAADLKGINARLGSFTTRFNSDVAKRSHNIRLAVKLIDGKILPPAKVFSMNETVGKRTHENGYLTANVIEHGKVVPGIGGGVSQVTGTLFNAVLLAGLPIKEYGTHARPVKYIPLGRDATVAWNHIDLKFQNNTPRPIYIAYKVSNGRLTATIYGTKKPGQQVTLSVASKKPAPNHIKATLYRTFKKNGKVIKKEEVGHSDYNWKAEEPD